ncbi:hypothetical protein HGRIS_010321 [Hohenbuehelia grisea]|uniref:Uncharacterized protein n=1 Tax=Hohenbuehelia grisea TaxID=104357 RepID=A0ABR3J4C4_9AGAR
MFLSFASMDRTTVSSASSEEPPGSASNSLDVYSRRASWLSTSSPSLISSSQYTTTSSRTIHGPGSLTGKALRRLGKAALGAYELIVIRRRLTTIADHFPHTDHHAAHIPGIAQMYEDILELVRPGLYTKEIRVRALRLLIGQITNCQTRSLISVLSRWDYERLIELQLLIYELINQDTSIWSSPERLEDNDAASLGSSRRPRTVSLPPDFWQLILFFSELIHISAPACRAVLDAGYLDALNSMCLTDFYYLFSTTIRIPQHLHVRMRIACAISFVDILAYPEFRDEIIRHGLIESWLSPTSSVQPEALVGYTNFLVDPRDMLVDESSPYLQISVPDVREMECVSKMTPENLLRSLTTHILHKQALSVFVARASNEERVNFFSSLISFLESKTETERQYSELFFRLPSYVQLLVFLQLANIWVESGFADALHVAGLLPFLANIVSFDLKLQAKLSPNKVDLFMFTTSVSAARSQIHEAMVLRMNGYRRHQSVWKDVVNPASDEPSDVLNLTNDILRHF